MNILNLILENITQQDLLNYYNATIIYDNLPKKINGLVFLHDCVNFIIINKNLSTYKRKQTILHELAHIELCQLEQVNNDIFEFYIDKYEDEASKYLKFIEDGAKEYKKEKRYFSEYFNDYY